MKIKTFASITRLLPTAAIAILLFSFAVTAQAGIFDNLMSNVLGVNSPDRRLAAYEQAGDKQLVNAFYTLSPDGKTEIIPEVLGKARFEFKGMNDSMITYRRHLGESTNMQLATSSLSSYQSNADTDEIAQTYAALAVTRGNVVRVYQPQLGSRISAGFNVIGMTPDAKRREFYGYDRVLIEFDNSGRIVSFINRTLQGVTTFGVSMYQYTAVYSGQQSVRHLEDSLNQREMEKYYIRDLNPSSLRANSVSQIQPASAASAVSLVSQMQPASAASSTGTINEER